MQRPLAADGGFLLLNKIKSKLLAFNLHPGFVEFKLKQMAFIDYYKILGVDKAIPQKDIRAAYKRRARQFHPDLHPDDPKAKAKFQALNEAYDVLGDPEKRDKYDRYGEHWRQAEACGGGPDWGNGAGTSWTGGFSGFDFSRFAEGGGDGGFSSFFEERFGRARGTRGRASAHARPQADMNVTVTIDLYTALLGGDILLRIQGDRLRLHVKPETQNGAKVRLRGKGYSRGDGTHGDLIVTYAVKLPVRLTERQRELLREMRGLG